MFAITNPCSTLDTFPDLQVVLDDVFFCEHGAEYHWTLLGDNTGPGGTGHRVRISGYEMWRISEGNLIAASQGHFDSAEYQRQIECGVDG